MEFKALTNPITIYNTLFFDYKTELLYGDDYQIIPRNIDAELRRKFEQSPYYTTRDGDFGWYYENIVPNYPEYTELISINCAMVSINGSKIKKEFHVFDTLDSLNKVKNFLELASMKGKKYNLLSFNARQKFSFLIKYVFLKEGMGGFPDKDYVIEILDSKPWEGNIFDLRYFLSFNNDSLFYNFSEYVTNMNLPRKIATYPTNMFNEDGKYNKNDFINSCTNDVSNYVDLMNKFKISSL